MNKEEKAFEPDSGFDGCKEIWEISEDFAIKSITDQQTIEKVSEYAHSAYKEDPTEYSIRLKNTEVPNLYEQAIQDAIDKVFDDSDTVKIIDTDPKIQIYLDDVDSRGNSLATIAKQIFKNLMFYGDGGGIVDFSMESPEDRANNKPYKGRPYFINMPSNQVIGMVTRQIKGVESIVQLRFYTQEIESDLDFNEINVERVREYSLIDNKVQLTSYTKKDNEITSEQVEVKGVSSLSKIPLCVASINKGGINQPFRNTPPLSSLLRGCIELLRLKSTDNNAVAVVTTPMLVEEKEDGFADQLQQLLKYDSEGNLLNDASIIAINAGIDDSRSPNKVWVKKPGEKMYYVSTNEFKAGIEASEMRIDKLTTDLKSSGLNSLLEQTARETVVKTITNNSTSQSRLSAIAVEVTNCLNEILVNFGVFIGVDKDKVGKVTIDMDFGSLDKNSLKSDSSMQALRYDFEQGIIDKERFLMERIARGSYAIPITDDEIEVMVGNAEADIDKIVDES